MWLSVIWNKLITSSSSNQTKLALLTENDTFDKDGKTEPTVLNVGLRKSLDKSNHLSSGQEKQLAMKSVAITYYYSHLIYWLWQVAGVHKMQELT